LEIVFHLESFTVAQELQWPKERGETDKQWFTDPATLVAPVVLHLLQTPWYVVNKEKIGL
jgi:hypothetical protein